MQHPVATCATDFVVHVLRYGLERPVIIRIGDHLDGFRMIRLALYIRES